MEMEIQELDSMSVVSQTSTLFDCLKSERLGIPNRLLIDGFRYSFKDVLKNNRFSYKCRARHCGVLMNIERKELDKMKLTGHIEIHYILSKEHTCIIKKNEDEYKPSNILQKEENKVREKETFDKEKSTVLYNIDKPLIWHVYNMKELNFDMSNEKIRNILQYQREKKFPYDNQFLYNMENITLTINYENKNPFCFEINKFINPKYNNREEKYIIYSSKYQLKHFCESNEIYIDNNYKICPKGYYQVMTILSYSPNTKRHLPVFFIPMSHKSKMSYKYVFKSIKNIIKDNGLIFDENGKIIICEFDYSLRIELKKSFNKAKIKGCFFHFIKILWIKTKRLGLCKKNIMKYTDIIIFAMKMICLIKNDYKNEFIKGLDSYIEKLPENIVKDYQSLMDYFKDNWLKSKFIHFDKIKKREYLYRINNICESYHNKLSNSIDYFYPKMASLVKELKDISINYFIHSISNNEEVIETKQKRHHYDQDLEENDDEIYIDKNSFEEMYYFVFNYHQKYKNRINVNSLINLENEFKERLKQININDMKCIFGLQCMSGVEDEMKYDNNSYNYEEIEQIIPMKDKKRENNKKENKDKRKIEEWVDIDYDNFEENDDKSYDKDYYENYKFDDLYYFEIENINKNDKMEEDNQ